jgi:hypothetical protein
MRCICSSHRVIQSLLIEFWCGKFLENGDMENSIRIGEDTILQNQVLGGDGDCDWKIPI